MALIKKVLSEISESVPAPKFKKMTLSEYQGGPKNPDNGYIYVAEVDGYEISYTGEDAKGFKNSVSIFTEDGESYQPIPKMAPKTEAEAKKLATFAALQLANGVPLENLKQFG